MRLKTFSKVAVAALAVTAFTAACSDDDEPSDDPEDVEVDITVTEDTGAATTTPTS